jgi:predicted dehydrogenase
MNNLSRRQFLALSALGAASAERGFTRPAQAAQYIRVGVIGCGRRGLAHLDTLARMHGAGWPVLPVMACDTHPGPRETARARYGVAVFADWREMLARPDIDAVMIAAPDTTHSAMAIAALDAGKHVYCEPPMALHGEAAHAFAEAAQRTGCAVQIGVPGMTGQSWTMARDFVRSGVLGELTRVQASGQIGIGLNPDSVSCWRSDWASSNGPALETLFCLLTPLLSVVGPVFPDRVSTAGGVFSGTPRQTPDALTATFEYPGGLTVVLTAGPSKALMRPPVIRGRDASLSIETDAILLTPEAHAKDRFRTRAPLRIPVQPGPDPIEDWLHAMLEQRSCACPPALAYPAQAAIGLAAQAYRRETAVRV